MNIKVKIERRNGGFVAIVTEKNGCWVNSSLDSDRKKDGMTRPTIEEALGVLVQKNLRLFGISIENAAPVNGHAEVRVSSNEEEMLARQDNE